MTKKKTENQLTSKITAFVGATVLGLLSLTTSVVLTTLTVKLLYDWFVLPLFSSSEVGFAHALGLFVTVNYVMRQILGIKVETKTGTEWMYPYLFPVFVLGFAYVIKFWCM